MWSKWGKAQDEGAEEAFGGFLAASLRFARLAFKALARRCFRSSAWLDFRFMGGNLEGSPPPSSDKGCGAPAAVACVRPRWQDAAVAQW